MTQDELYREAMAIANAWFKEHAAEISEIYADYHLRNIDPAPRLLALTEERK